MINKKVKYTFKGANQDFTKSKHPNQYYYEAGHIRILATDDQSTGSITNEKGTTLIFTIPDISINSTTNVITYGTNTITYNNGNEIDQQITDGILPISSTTQKIINITNTRTGIIIFSTDDNGMDCIWEIPNLLNNDYSYKLLYLRNLNFSSNFPIQSIFNYENENIQKVYWVDGKEQVRFINIKDNLINLPSTSINSVSIVNFSQPKIIDKISGGNHTSGMIQYAYNLYKKNSSQSKISPLSELVSLDKGDGNGGGELNEIVGSTPVVKIDNIDTTYDFIKIYAIKYTSYNEIPSINLIDESEISGSSITIYDDGSTIESLSLEEFVFLGSDPIIPKHIHTKDNRLFSVNIKTKPFILPDELDTRAYSFSSGGNSRIISDTNFLNNSTYVPDNYNVDPKSDAINYDYDLYKYQKDGTTLGGEGKFIRFRIIQKDLDSIQNVFKDEEIYRIGVEFYNNLGQTSLPKWVADYKMPKGNLSIGKNTLFFAFKNEFYTWLNSYNFQNEEDKIVGYRVIRAERNEFDKTILAQGILSSMVFQVTGENVNGLGLDSINIRETYQDSKLKVPTPLIRNFEGIPNGSNSAMIIAKNNHLGELSISGLSTNGEDSSEIRGTDISQSFQHTKMMQLYSPEIIFDDIPSFTNNLKLKIKALELNSINGIEAQERIIDTKQIRYNGKTLGGLNPRLISSNNYIEDNNFVNIFDYPSVIAPSFRDDAMNFKQYYRSYNIPNDSYINTNNKEYDIYGSPEILERGDDPKFYNNDPRYNYSNSLESIITGRLLDGRNIKSVNTWGAKSAMIVLGNDVDTNDRKGIEDLYTESNLSDETGILLVEIKRDKNYVYTGNIYGGNSYEDKKRTSYIGIGEYRNINFSNIQIDEPGDTYVSNFRFLRLGKTDTEVYDVDSIQLTEIVEFQVETTIDLKNRNDISLSEWDARFQPRFDEYHKYNNVYSQESNLIKNTDTSFNFEQVETFDTRIQASKLKTPNELIDSWTDILVNETIELDGKFGPINNIVEYKDNLFSFQDEAIAQIVINPRIQVQASDGVGIELGTGKILYDYKYLTTKSGSINKWGIQSTKKGIYYYDALNKGIGRIPDSTSLLLTDIKGMHSFFNNNYDYSLIKEDNPIIKKGVTFGYDNYNNDLYITFHQSNKSFTRCYNELLDEFIDLKLYLPSLYNYKGEKLLSGDNNKLYEHHTGEYNKFYGNYYPSYIILQLNPESDMDTVFNNIFYNSEVYLNDIDQPNITLTHIQAYNEYQDSGRIPLIVGRDSNLRRKFREWKANIPRMKRNRIRNHWIYLKLEFQNKSNYKLILHDIIINYSI